MKISNIVKEEIESWYLAGVDNSFDKFKDSKILDNTDKIEKEYFDKIYASSFDSNNECLIEIAKHFNLEQPENTSFKYFLDKLSVLSK